MNLFKIYILAPKNIHYTNFKILHTLKMLFYKFFVYYCRLQNIPCYQRWI